MTRNATLRSRATSRLASTLLEGIDSIGGAAGITGDCGQHPRSALSTSPCEVTKRRRISSSRPLDTMSAGFVRLPTSSNPTRTDDERVHLDSLCEDETALERTRRHDPG